MYLYFLGQYQYLFTFDGDLKCGQILPPVYITIMQLTHRHFNTSSKGTISSKPLWSLIFLFNIYKRTLCTVWRDYGNIKTLESCKWKSTVSKYYFTETSKYIRFFQWVGLCWLYLNSNYIYDSKKYFIFGNLQFWIQRLSLSATSIMDCQLLCQKFVE